MISILQEFFGFGSSDDATKSPPSSSPSLPDMSDSSVPYDFAPLPIPPNLTPEQQRGYLQHLVTNNNNQMSALSKENEELKKNVADNTAMSTLNSTNTKLALGLGAGIPAALVAGYGFSRLKNRMKNQSVY